MTDTARSRIAAIIPGTYLDVRTGTPVVVTREGDGFRAVWHDRDGDGWDMQPRRETREIVLAAMIGSGVLSLTARDREDAETLTPLETRRDRLDTEIQLMEQKLFRLNQDGPQTRFIAEEIKRLRQRIATFKAEYERVDTAIVAAVVS